MNARHRWGRWLILLVFVLLSVSWNGMIAQAAIFDDETGSLKAALEQDAHALLKDQMGLRADAVLTTQAIVMEPASARIDVQVEMKSEQLGLISVLVHVFALHDGQQIQHIFREPSPDFYLYAGQVSPELLPAERLEAWTSLYETEQRQGMKAMSVENYKLPFTGGEFYWVFQDYDKHFDFSLPEGTVVRAARGGTVHNGIDMYGAYYVCVQHSDGSYGFYIHLQANSYMVPEGVVIPQGAPLGYSGNTGYSTGPHLHFNVSTYLDNHGGDPFGVAYTAISFVEGAIPTEAFTPVSQNSTGPANAMPVGWIDAPRQNAQLQQYALISGWASAQGSGINRVEIWINGVYRGNARYGASRPDAGGDFGYAWSWDTTGYTNGPHAIQVKAVANSGASSFLLSNTAQTILPVAVNNPTNDYSNFMGEPNIHPVYGNGMCDSAWFRYLNEWSFYAYLTVSTNDPAQSTNWADWTPNLLKHGVYNVQAYIPNHAIAVWQCPPLTLEWDTTDARYTIHHASGQNTVVVNQAPLSNAWADLGNYYFNSGTGGWVELHDLNSEANWSHTVSFSSMKFTLVTSEQPPAAVQDLAVSFSTILPGYVTLTWSAPGADGYSGGPASQYDIRYSSSLINDETSWNSAAQVSGEPVPGNPGTVQSMKIYGLAKGTKWYFAIKSVDQKGVWSSISNVISMQDVGLRPNPNGYSFENWRFSFDGFSLDDVVQIFGEENVCAYYSSPVCIPKVWVAKWLVWVEDKLFTGGRCDGMSSTGIRFFWGLEKPSDFESYATTTYDLGFSKNIREYITYYQVLGMTDLVAKFREQTFDKPIAYLLDKISYGLSHSNDMVVVNIYQGTQKGHSLLPYAIQQINESVWHIWVYDSNYPYDSSNPNDSDRYLSINTSTNSWSYLFKTGELWSSTNFANSIGYVPIYLYNGPFPVNLSGSTIAAVGANKLLITNSQGQNIGFYRDEFFNEIPGAYLSVYPSGQGTGPSFSLSTPDDFRVEIDGQTITETTPVTISQLSANRFIAVGGIKMHPLSKERLNLNNDTLQVLYSAVNNQEVQFTLGYDLPDLSYELQVNGADINAGQSITVHANQTTNQLAIQGPQDNRGEYGLNIARIIGSKQYKYGHQRISIMPTDTHYLLYGNWDGINSIILQIDHNSDGTVDEEVALLNDLTTKYLYLPLVKK